MAENVIRIPPNQYIHVLDNNSNITRLEVGPATFIRKEHESIVIGPVPMINLPPRAYCQIENPIVRGKDRKPELTPFGQVKTNQGEFEYRVADDYPDPFPLYPGERLVGKIEKLLIIPQNNALRLTATRDFLDGEVKRVAGSEWQRKGPFTYIPRIEEEVVTIIKAEVIKPNTALKLSAIRDTKDHKGVDRKVGEEWLIRETGSYLPEVNEKVVETVKGHVITDKISLHLMAERKFKDVYGFAREAGEEWLVVSTMAPLHIKDVYERVVGIENAVTLTSREYCVIVNPLDPKSKKNVWGSRLLKKGELTFFLQPGEKLEKGIEKVKVLGEDEALLLLARNDFVDDSKQKRISGEKWLITGPREYIPPIEVDIVETRKSIPLDENEGIYLRDNRTGEVKMIKGQTYLLQAHESLWPKELPPVVEQLLAQAALGQPYAPPKIDEKGNLVYDIKVDPNWKRDPTKIITFKAQHNSAVQLYDFKQNKSRVVFGPDLVMLGPDEQFTVLTLSGGRPKKEGVIRTLALGLGPDFMSDIVIVETSDHARLSLSLAYNWYFKFDKTNPKDVESLFSVKDFVGDACKSIASRVRGAVSGITFEDFHHHSSVKIREAVFGKNKDGSLKEELFFPSNGMMITSVDIQNVEITDEKTRNYLAKSINQAIEIHTKSQEANSKHQAERLDQEAKGQLLRQKLEDDARAEESKIKLLELQAESAVVSTKGQAIANANAKAEAEYIACQAEVKQAELKAQAMEFEGNQEIEQLQKSQIAELEHKKALYDLEIKKAKEMADIEIKKFKQIVGAIGQETIVEISKAGPEMKAQLLKGLGLKGYLVSDGKNPINLFNTANGFLGEQAKK